MHPWLKPDRPTGQPEPHLPNFAFGEIPLAVTPPRFAARLTPHRLFLAEWRRGWFSRVRSIPPVSPPFPHSDPTAVQRVNPLAVADWDERVARFSGASIFHSAAWARVLHETY